MEEDEDDDDDFALSSIRTEDIGFEARKTMAASEGGKDPFDEILKRWKARDEKLDDFENLLCSETKSEIGMLYYDEVDDGDGSRILRRAKALLSTCERRSKYYGSNIVEPEEESFDEDIAGENLVEIAHKRVKLMEESKSNALARRIEMESRSQYTGENTAKQVALIEEQHKALQRDVELEQEKELEVLKKQGETTLMLIEEQCARERKSVVENAYLLQDEAFPDTTIRDTISETQDKGTTAEVPENLEGPEDISGSATPVFVAQEFELSDDQLDNLFRFCIRNVDMFGREAVVSQYPVRIQKVLVNMHQVLVCQVNSGYDFGEKFFRQVLEKQGKGNSKLPNAQKRVSRLLGKVLRLSMDMMACKLALRDEWWELGKEAMKIGLHLALVHFGNLGNLGRSDSRLAFQVDPDVDLVDEKDVGTGGIQEELAGVQQDERDFQSKRSVQDVGSVQNELDVQQEREDELNVQQEREDELDVQQERGDELDAQQERGDELDAQQEREDELEVQQEREAELEVGDDLELWQDDLKLPQEREYELEVPQERKYELEVPEERSSQGEPSHREEHGFSQGEPSHREEHGSSQGEPSHHGSSQGEPSHHGSSQGEPSHREEHASSQGEPSHREELGVHEGFGDCDIQEDHPAPWEVPDARHMPSFEPSCQTSYSETDTEDDGDHIQDIKQEEIEEEIKQVHEEDTRTQEDEEIMEEDEDIRTQEDEEIMEEEIYFQEDIVTEENDIEDIIEVQYHKRTAEVIMEYHEQEVAGNIMVDEYHAQEDDNRQEENPILEDEDLLEEATYAHKDEEIKPEENLSTPRDYDEQVIDSFRLVGGADNGVQENLDKAEVQNATWDELYLEDDFEDEQQGSDLGSASCEDSDEPVDFSDLCEIVTRMQALVRGHICRMQLKRERNISKVQAWWRGSKVRRRLQLERRMATRIQSKWRGSAMREKFRRALARAKYVDDDELDYSAIDSILFTVEETIIYNQAMQFEASLVSLQHDRLSSTRQSSVAEIWQSKEESTPSPSEVGNMCTSLEPSSGSEPVATNDILDELPNVWEPSLPAVNPTPPAPTEPTKSEAEKRKDQISSIARDWGFKNEKTVMQFLKACSKKRAKDDGTSLITQDLRKRRGFYNR